MEIAVTLPPAKTLQQARAMESYYRREYREAIDLFQKALEETETAECWNDLGCSQVACKLYDEATASFRRAIELDRTYAQAAQNLGALLAVQGRNAEAIPILKQAQKTLNPKDRASLTPLIEHCLKESRVLTQPAFQWGARPGCFAW